MYFLQRGKSAKFEVTIQTKTKLSSHEHIFIQYYYYATVINKDDFPFARYFDYSILAAGL